MDRLIALPCAKLIAGLTRLRVHIEEHDAHFDERLARIEQKIGGK